MMITRPFHTLDALSVRTRLSHTEPHHPGQSPLLLVFLVGFLLFSPGACSGGASSTTVPSQATVPTARLASPTPTSLPAGTVIYQADWSHGLAGWPGAQGWKVVQGQLESDSGGSASFTIPYSLTVSDYVVEVRIEVVSVLQQSGGYFIISAPKSPGKDGYEAGISNLLGSAPHPMAAHPQCQVFLDPFEDIEQGTGLPTAYYQQSGWHTYRVEVQGNEARLLIDGVQISSVSSVQTNPISNGPIMFSSQLVILRMSSLRILTL